MSYHFDRFANLRKRTRALDANAKARRKESPPPHEIRYAVAGTHVASDGKPYTITYQPEGTWREKSR